MRGQRGFTLIEVAITAGLLAILSLTVVSLVNTTTSSISNTESQFGSASLRQSILAAVSSSASCSYRQKLPPTTVTEGTAFSFPLKLDDNSYIIANAVLPNYKVTVTDLQVRNPQSLGADPCIPGSTLYSGSLVLSQNKLANGNVMGGVSLNDATIGNIAISLDASGNLMRCTAGSPTDACDVCLAMGGTYNPYPVAPNPNCTLPYPCASNPGTVFLGYDTTPSHNAICKTLTPPACAAGTQMVPNGLGGVTCAAYAPPPPLPTPTPTPTPGPTPTPTPFPCMTAGGACGVGTGSCVAAAASCGGNALISGATDCGGAAPSCCCTCSTTGVACVLGSECCSGSCNGGFCTSPFPSPTPTPTPTPFISNIYVGGSFTNYSGTPEVSVARLNSDGSLDNTFKPTGSGLNGPVYAIAVDSSGKVIVGGGFSSYNGAAANQIARLNPDGSLDATFNTTGSGFNGLWANQGIFALAIDSSGKIVVGGRFTNYNGTSEKHVARLNSDGSLDATFNPTGSGLDNNVHALAIDSLGRIVVVGCFLTYNGISMPYVARLNSDGSLDPTFVQTGSGWGNGVGALNGYAVAIESTGKILVGGDISNGYNGISEPFVARLNTDGSLDNTFNPMGSGLDNNVQALGIDSLGRSVVSGYFGKYNGTPTFKVAKLNNGALDGTFAEMGAGLGAAPLTFVHSLAIDSTDKVLIGGNFTSYNGVSAPYVARLNSDGSLDNTFNPVGAGLDNTVLRVITISKPLNPPNFLVPGVIQYQGQHFSAGLTDLTLPINPTNSGDLIVVAVDPGGSNPATSVTDDAGNIYSDTGAYAGGVYATDLWYARNSNAGATAITAHFGVANPDGMLWMVEVYGADLVNPFHTGIGSANIVPSPVANGPAVTTTTPNEFIFALVGLSGQAFSTTNSFVGLPYITGDDTAFYVASTPGVYNAAWNTQNTTEDFATASFRLANMGGLHPPASKLGSAFNPINAFDCSGSFGAENNCPNYPDTQWGVCSNVAIAEIQDSLGKPTITMSNTTVNLSGAGFIFYSDNICSKPITSVTIPAGGASGYFYFEGTASGTITMSATGLTSYSLPVTIGNANSLGGPWRLISSQGGDAGAYVTNPTQHSGFLGQATGAGNLLIAACQDFPAGLPMTLSDDAGNVYVKSPYSDSPPFSTHTIFYAPNSKPGATTITVTASGATTYMNCQFVEVNDSNGISPGEEAGTGPGKGENWGVGPENVGTVSVPITTSVAGDLIVSFFWGKEPVAFSIYPGFTAFSYYHQIQGMYAPAAGPNQGGITINQTVPANNWRIDVHSFKQ